MKSRLLDWNSKPDFWLLISFTIVTLTLFLIYLPRRKTAEAPENDARSRAIAALKRGHAIRIARSLGLVLLREMILDLMGVSLYGTFRRPSTWGSEPTRFKCVDRISYKGGVGVEFQYPKTFDNIFVRTHPANDDNYSAFEERLPTLREVALLLVASNFFPFWLPVFLIRRTFKRSLKVVGL